MIGNCLVIAIIEKLNNPSVRIKKIGKWKLGQKPPHYYWVSNGKAYSFVTTKDYIPILLAEGFVERMSKTLHKSGATIWTPKEKGRFICE